MAKQFLPGIEGVGGRWRRQGGGQGRGQGEGEEMTQTLYAHMNKRKKKNKFRKVLATLLFNIVFVSKVLDKEMK
jgi:hypothetical protein